MRKELVSIVIFCFFMPLAKSEQSLPVEFEREFSYENEKIIVKSEKIGLEKVHLKVYRGKNSIYSYKGEILEKRLSRLNFASPLLLLFWKVGVHGEIATVLDVKKKKVVWEEFSTWPMELIVKKKKVRIDYTGEQLAVDKFEEFSKIFHLK